MNFRAVLAVLATALTSACAAPPSAERVPAGAPAAADASRELQRLVDDYFEEWLRLNPLQATSIGDGRYNDRFDVLEAKVDRWIASERGG